MKRTSRLLSALLVGLMVLHSPPPLVAQDAAQPAPAAAPAAPPFKPEEIEQIVAPIALYPDPVLAQVLMASTYPLEIVEAARWRKQNPDLKDAALENALQQQIWDPSVKSLTAFPDVLTMMNEELAWTQKLGDAFLAQQKDVMDAVQQLRAKARAAGNLESNEQQKVIVEPAAAVNVQQNVTVQQPAPGEAPAPAPAPPTVIRIEQANPQVVYVPTYSPAVYGPWPYPAYPPYSYYPPGYVAGTALLSFGVGMAVGAAVWGNCDWGHGDVNINTNNYNNFNKTNVANGKWQHNVDHRKGVQYRDNATRQKYNRGSQGNQQSREAFRGRAEQGRQQIARGGASDFKGPAAPPADRGGRAATQKGPAAAQRDVGGARAPAQPQRQAAQTRDTGRGRDPAAFQGVGNGQQTRAQSDRGRASRQSAAAFGGGAGARPGGGGARPGGGGGAPRGGGGRGGGGGGRR